MDEIRDAAALRDHMGPVSRLAEGKVQTRLDRHARAFIALSPFLVVATADGEGRADASPRGDAPGFVQVIDDATLLIPDRRGNNRADSFGNLLAAPGIGLIFLVPGITETLRINGTAALTTDPALLTPLAAQGKVPATGLVVALREVFFHCGKAVMRARLWDPAAQVPRDSFPSLGRVLSEQTGAIGVSEAERLMDESYRTRLY